MGGGYEEVGSYSDMYGKNLNPYTEGTMSSLQRQGDWLSTMLKGMSPGGMVAGLGQQATGLSDIASQLMGGYNAASNNLAGLQARENVRNILNEYSMGNSLYSGAAGIGTERAAALPWAEALTNQANLQAQLGGGLAQAFTGAYQNQYGTLASLFGGTQGNLTGLSGYSQYEPTFEYKPSFLEQYSQLVGANAGIAAAALL